MRLNAECKQILAMSEHMRNAYESVVAERDALRERLEWHKDGYDGIYCRDETIRQLDKRVDELRAKVEALRATLRKHAIYDENCCAECNSAWPLHGSERHADGCLAAPKEGER